MDPLSVSPSDITSNGNKEKIIAAGTTALAVAIGMVLYHVIDFIFVTSKGAVNKSLANRANKVANTAPAAQ